MGFYHKERDRKEFANTTTTISQALQVAGNNVTKFFGENSTVKTGAAIFNDAVVTASENIGVLSAALTAAAAIMGSRYVGALTMSAASQISLPWQPSVRPLPMPRPLSLR